MLLTSILAILIKIVLYLISWSEDLQNKINLIYGYWIGEPQEKV